MSKRSLPSSISRGLVLLFVGLMASPAVATPAAGELSKIASEVLSDSAYQTELPESATPSPGPPVSPGAGRFATLLLYVALIVVVVLVVLWAIREFFPDHAGAGRSRGERAADEQGPGGADLLGDPERLAAQGRYEEAIHTLLLVSIRHLGRDLPIPPSPSTTSRELLHGLPLTADRREAFRFLVRQVELSLFGGSDVNAGDYTLCRRRFEQLIPEGTR